MKHGLYGELWLPSRIKDRDLYALGTSVGWDAASNPLASCDDIADQCLENDRCADARGIMGVSSYPNPKFRQDKSAEPSAWHN